ncbi:MAG: hypothetical protein O3C40_29670 [Planctomycetota bacterium]|nr:hypothetical protein [Planctomycetota bacterium]
MLKRVVVAWAVLLFPLLFVQCGRQPATVEVPARRIEFNGQTWTFSQASFVLDRYELMNGELYLGEDAGRGLVDLKPVMANGPEIRRVVMVARDERGGWVPDGLTRCWLSDGKVEDLEYVRGDLIGEGELREFRDPRPDDVPVQVN